jgi:hypothetical protein
VVSRRRQLFAGLLAVIVLGLLNIPAHAFEIWSDKEGERTVGLDVSGKWSSLTSHAPDDTMLYPKRDTWTELFRLRLGLNVQYYDWLSGELAYEQRAKWLSDKAGGSAGGGILPSEAEAPFRIRQLDSEITEAKEVFFYRHEIDRAVAAFHLDWGEATLGRQAIGLGRGTLFSAVDVFAPFSPLEIDREWRRGVDAVRIEGHISDTSSVELIGAFGPTWEKSALLGRARGYFGNIDAELIFGKRAKDTMLGGTVSGTIGDAEAHAELAFFNTPETQPDGGLAGNDHQVGKLVAGGSYTFNIGNGLTILGEYHYSGFGVKDIDDATSRLLSSDFLERFLRGDSQILGRQALAIQATYPFSHVWSGALLVLQSPADGSGVLSPSLTWDFSDNASLVGSIFVPWGDEPSAGTIRSEFGGTPLSLFLQLRVYY